MSKPKGSSNAESMEFETFVMPNLNNERAKLAREAGSIGKAELVERAEALGVPTGGTKEAISERVKDAARND